MAFVAPEQDGNLGRLADPRINRGRHIVQKLIARREAQLIAGGDQDRLPDQLSLEDALNRAQGIQLGRTRAGTAQGDTIPFFGSLADGSLTRSRTSGVRVSALSGATETRRPIVAARRHFDRHAEPARQPAD